jgi:2-C-methyl-D-erythritol 4-phosphate cytidylyltransferase
MIAAVRARAAGVVLAGGSGVRMGAGMNKAYLPLAGRRLISWSLLALSRVPEVGVLLLVIRPDDRELVEATLADELDGVEVELAHGGGTRQESELAALRHLAGRVENGAVDVVLLHDAARPLVSPELITAVLRTAREHGGAIPGLPADDIATLGADGRLVDGSTLELAIRAQTPQGFRAAPLLAAYEQAERERFDGTDTASCMERYSELPVRWVRGEQRNFKITYPHDLTVAEHLLAGGQGHVRPAGTPAGR